MNTETTGNGLFAALAKLQADLPKIGKNATAQYGKYADLADVSAIVLPQLGKYGLAFTARPTMHDGSFVLAYSLVHVCGEREDGFYPLPANGNSQQLGSAITYARRYSLCAVTGVAPDEDDDGAAAVSAPWQGRSGGDWERSTPAPPRQSGNSRQQDRKQQARPSAEAVDAWRDRALNKHATPDELLALLGEIERAGHDGLHVADETGERVTFKDLIVRKGKEARAAAGHAEPSALRAPEQVPFAAEDDAEFVTGFAGRLAESTTKGHIALRRRDLELARNKQQVTEATYGELTEDIGKREQQIAEGKAAA